MNGDSLQATGGKAPSEARPSRGRAFGLGLESDLPVLGLDDSRDGAAEPDTRLTLATPGSIDATWPAESAERVVDHRYPDGSAMMTVDADAERGYRIDAPGHGRFLVAADGSTVRCAPAQGPAWRWHRPLFAQALPLAAALNEIEVLHASGVVLDGRAVGFVGRSGAGKTSLAIQLVDQGASLLADDVLAISNVAGIPHAHPGVRFSNVAAEQVKSVASGSPRRLGPIVGHSEKLHILVDRIAGAASPLTVLYYLDRGPRSAELAFERLQPPDLNLLLGSTCLPYVKSPARMTLRLTVCAAISKRVATYLLRVPPWISSTELAPLVAAHSRDA